jgi:hypothetical protein
MQRPISNLLVLSLESSCQMPEAYRIDAAHRLVIGRAWGIVTADDIHRHYARLRADPAFIPAYRQLADLRDVERVEADSASVQREARQRTFSANAGRAFVVQEAHVFGMIRMFGTIVEISGSSIEIFSTLAAALKWLDLPADFDVRIDR